MGVVFQTGKKPEHSGVVTISFLDEKGLAFSSKAYTMADAAMVYDAMRERYPEHADKMLRVRVLDEQELSPHDRKRLYSKGLVGKPPIVEPGCGFVRDLLAIGPRPSFPLADPLGGSATIETGEDSSWVPKAAELIQAFVGEVRWERAESLDLVLQSPMEP